MKIILLTVFTCSACLSVPPPASDAGQRIDADPLAPDADPLAPDADPLAPDAASSAWDKLGEYAITWTMIGGTCAEPKFAADKVLIERPNPDIVDITITWENDCGAPVPVSAGGLDDAAIHVSTPGLVLESCDGKWIETFDTVTDFYFGAGNSTAFYEYPIPTSRAYFTDWDTPVCSGSYRLDGARL